MISPDTGARDKRVTLRRRNDKARGDAELVSDYTVLGGRWARIEPLGTLLVNSGITVGNKITHRVIFSMLRGLDQGCEVVCGARLFRVAGVGNLNEAGIDTILEVEEITGNPQSAESVTDNDAYGDPYE